MADDVTTEPATEHSAEPKAPQRKQPLDIWVKGLLALALILGLALRLWGIGWGLPDARHPLATYHPDEWINLNAAEPVDIPHGKFDIGFYNYGTLYFYGVSLGDHRARLWHDSHPSRER